MPQQSVRTLPVSHPNRPDGRRPTARRYGLRGLVGQPLVAAFALALSPDGFGASPQEAQVAYADRSAYTSRAAYTDQGAYTDQAAYADQVVVNKSQRWLRLLRNGQVMRQYRIALGRNPTGHKLQAGDARTPVGDYILDWRNPSSQYYKSIHISYPSVRDRALSASLGVDPGGMIMLHGLPNTLTTGPTTAKLNYSDWTNGCIAVQDREMDEIWRLVRDGTPIRIMN